MTARGLRPAGSATPVAGATSSWSAWRCSESLDPVGLWVTVGFVLIALVVAVFDVAGGRRADTPVAPVR